MGLAAELTAEPSPKFQEYIGVPVVEFKKLAFNEPQPEIVDVLKLTTGVGATLTTIDVSCEHPAEDTVRCTV